MNKAMLIGNLTKDPEMRYTPNGAAVTSFSVATSKKRGDKEFTQFHNIVVWGTAEKAGLAGLAAQYLKKGSKVYVEGQIETRKWEKDGQPRYSTEIVLNAFDGVIEFLSGTRSKEEATSMAAPAGPPASSVDPSEIPF